MHWWLIPDASQAHLLKRQRICSPEVLCFFSSMTKSLFRPLAARCDCMYDPAQILGRVENSSREVATPDLLSSFLRIPAHARRCHRQGTQLRATSFERFILVKGRKTWKNTSKRISIHCSQRGRQAVDRLLLFSTKAPKISSSRSSRIT